MLWATHLIDEVDAGRRRGRAAQGRVLRAAAVGDVVAAPTGARRHGAAFVAD